MKWTHRKLVSIFFIVPILANFVIADVSFAATTPTCPSLTNTLQLGTYSSQVVQLKLFLEQQGYLSGVSNTNYFGPSTQTAVKAFQKKMGIVSSGTPATTGYGAVGKKTRAAIVSACSNTSVNSRYSEASYNSQSGNNETNTYRQGAYYSQPAYSTSAYAQPSYYGQSNYVSSTSTYAQASYYSQSSYYAQSSYAASCVPDASSPQSRVLNCAVGQTGTVLQSRVSSCAGGASSPSWSDWATTTSTCAHIALPCTFGAQTVNSGSTVTAYQSPTVAFGSVCQSQIRRCTDGALSGTYTNSSCSVSGASSCSVSGITLMHGTSKLLYLNSTVPYGQACQSEIRTCTNGALSGSFTNLACMVGSPASCMFNGSGVPHGTSVTAYQLANVAYGGACTPEMRNCNNGTLSGSFTSATCTVGTATACTFNGTAIVSGTSVTAFQASSVTAPASCISESRVCSNGALTGSYAFSTCSIHQQQCSPAATSPESQTIPCPSGQIGSITQTRISTCAVGATLPTWSAWATSANTCVNHVTTVTRADVKTVALGGNNIYSPSVITQNGLRYLYYGGWMNAGQTHDNIYRAQCGNLGDNCTGAQSVLNPQSYGFDHLNDPSVIRMPGGSYLMYMTGLVQGLNAFTASNNKIYVSTSAANDGVTWSAPQLVISNAWLPSATIGPTGEVEVFGNETIEYGNVVRFKMGTSGMQPAHYEPLIFSNGAFYLNPDVVYRPSLGAYQMFAERQGSTAIDYLTSTDGTHFTLAASDIATSQSAGLQFIRTPGQDSETASWLYFAGTNNPNASQNQMMFESWSTQ